MDVVAAFPPKGVNFCEKFKGLFVGFGEGRGTPPLERWVRSCAMVGGDPIGNVFPTNCEKASERGAGDQPPRCRTRLPPFWETLFDPISAGTGVELSTFPHWLMNPGTVPTPLPDETYGATEATVDPFTVGASS